MVLYRDCYLKYFYMEFKLFILYFVHHEYAIAISGKGKSIHFSLCVKHHATKTYAGVLTFLTLNLGTRQARIISFLLRSLYDRRCSPRCIVDRGLNSLQRWSGCHGAGNNACACRKSNSFIPPAANSP
jgi:hypothetical protein